MEAKKGRISNKRRLEKKTSVRNGPIAFGERVSTAEAAILRHEMETQSGLIDCARTKGRESTKTQLASPSPSDVDSRKSIRRKHPPTRTHAGNFFLQVYMRLERRKRKGTDVLFVLSHIRRRTGHDRNKRISQSLIFAFLFVFLSSISFFVFVFTPFRGDWGYYCCVLFITTVFFLYKCPVSFVLSMYMRQAAWDLGKGRKKGFSRRKNKKRSSESGICLSTDHCRICWIKE
ncbi:hypothetical protein BKA57DRAFT_50999 [Linnemannia elongata]|nr:hypothetical protein BKA57DRAFT_50999 [Linnemannia elongata]